MCQNSDEAQSSILARILDQYPRPANIAGLGFWLAAIAVLILYANHLGLRSATVFMLADSWLIGAGCVGVPVRMLGLLGRHLSPRALELIAAVSFTGAGVVTVFVGTGQAHLGTWTACFLLILFLALGIQALNGAYGLDRRRRIAEQVRAEERAERERDVKAAYLRGLLDAHSAQRRQSEEIGKLLEMPTEEIVGLQAALDEEIHDRRAKHLAAGGSAQILQLFKQSGLPPTGSEPE